VRAHILNLIAAAGLAALAFAVPVSASATPLHGYCVGVACPDNGTNSPTALNPPVFAFSTSGQDATGDYRIGILVPSDDPAPASFTILDHNNNAITFTALPLSTTTAWTTGELGAYMTSVGATNISGGSGHPLGAYLPATQALDPSATGFWVYVADLGTQTVESQADVFTGLELELSGQMPLGGYLLGFLGEQVQHCHRGVCTTTTDWSMNANSGAILETNPNCPDCHTENVPEPLTLSLFGAGLAGGFALRRRRKAGKSA
jgi:PEP-CTERM motif-containing protein